MLCLSHSLNGCFVQCCRKNDEKVLKMKNSTFGKLTVGMLSVAAIALTGVFVVGDGKSASEPVFQPSSSKVSTFHSSEGFDGVKIESAKGEKGSSKSDFTEGLKIVIPEPEPVPVLNDGAKKSGSSSNSASSTNSGSDNKKEKQSKQENTGKKSSSNSENTAPKPAGTTWDTCINRVDPNRTVDWRIGSYGHYGQASTNYVLLGNHTPDHRKCAVVYHEWFHTVHARKEGGMENIINTYGRNRIESIADCGALMLGADWVHYGCGGETDRQKAREILGW